MLKANNADGNKEIVINVTINGNIIVGNDNNIVETASESIIKGSERKSALGELVQKIGKVIAKIVSILKAILLPWM